MEIKDLKRTRENMLDLSPDTGDSLKLALNFNADDFIKEDVEIGVKIRNLEIKLEIAKNQFARLFGA